ncbi:MAG: hypothetical protein QGH89_04935, partial [Candidatus Marinimicrobia bacterium]|nr:hypothetical protein [Candidatus Neomarinimicrobiota bacterium]
AEEFYAEYGTKLFGMDAVFSHSAVKRGELTDAMLENQYDQSQENYQRYSGFVEERSVTEIQFIKTMWKPELLVFFGLSFVDWKNAGLDPLNPNATKDIQKTSFTLGFSYNFRPPGLAGRSQNNFK